MARRAAAARSSVSIASAVLLTVAAPLVAYAAARNALNEAGGQRNASVVLPPPSIWAEMRQVMRTARLPRERLPVNALDVAERGAVKLPLAYEPYFIAARAEEQAGRYQRATVLMEEARRRRPSATSVRFLLLGYYSLANAYQKAIDEADMAMRVNGRSATLILPAFAKLVAADPKARQAIAVALAKQPGWRDAFLDVAANEGLSPEAAAALVADVRRLAPSRRPGAEEAFLVRSLVNAGEVQRARTLWESYLPAGEGQPGTIFDGTFRGLMGMAPFVWTFGANEDGNAEIAKAGAGGPSMLEANYFGDSVMTLAEQTLALKPGRYRLSSSYRGESSAEDVRLSWTITCLRANKPIAELPLDPLGPVAAKREVIIAVPASGCQGQKLALVGQPTDLARNLNAQILNVSLVPLG